jgi:hypothetical protein
MSRRTEGALSVLLAVFIAIAGALLAAHWAACEQYESFCSISN